MDEVILNAAASLGMGGLLAFIVLQWKRIDDKRFQETISLARKEALEIIAANTQALQEINKTIATVLEAVRKQSVTERALLRIEEKLDQIEKKEE